MPPAERGSPSGVDPAIGLVWRALADGSLSPDQQLQLRAMVRVLDDEQLAAAADDKVERRSRRGGPIRRVLRRFPGVLLTLWRVVELIDRIGWPVVAAVLAL